MHLKTDEKCFLFILRILKGKKYPKIKLQRLRGFLRDFKTETNFPKNKAVTGNTPVFVIGHLS